MKNNYMKKSFAASIAAALVVTMSVAIPSTARAADPTCTDAGSSYQLAYESCTGVDDLGAKYEIRMPSKFNGTLMLWSHGIRYAVPLPAIPVVNPVATAVNMEAEVAPSEAIASELLLQGYALAGSGFNRQGWNAEDAVISNIQLINLAKTKYAKIKKVTAWGASMGGFITQSLQEQFPAMIDAAAPLCTATNTPLAEFKYAGDFLFGIKTFFDPTIMGSGYAAGQAGYLQMIGDIQKVLTVFGSISAAITANPVAPAWPASSTAPAALKAIPVRSALLLVGLIAGIPTQSNSFDSSSGPAGPLETSFGLAISPALAVLENGVQGAMLAIVGTYGEEMKMGGRFYDNTATNWAAQVSQDDLDSYNAALSGTSAITAMLGYLTVAGQRAAANPIAKARFESQYVQTGQINVPTVAMTGLADPITPAGNTQWLIDRGTNAKHLVVLWNRTPETYTEFNGQSPVSKSPAAATNGTGHCNFTQDQWLLAAKIANTAAKTGKLPTLKTINSLVAKVNTYDTTLFVDPDFAATPLKYNQ